MELKDLLNVALKVEATGYETYSRLAEENTGKMKDLFDRLAKQEREHQEIFKALFEEYTKSDQSKYWVDTENAGYLMSFAEMSIFPKLSSENKPKDLTEAIRMAVEVEKDSIIFYSDLKEFFPDKTSIQKIIREEQQHMMDLLGYKI